MEKIETTFKNFAEFLFDQENPENNTLHVNLNFKDDEEFCHFLYELFCYGFQKKFGNDLQINDINQEQFNTLKKYIRALGSDVTLTEKTNENDELMVNFLPYYSNEKSDDVGSSSSI